MTTEGAPRRPLRIAVASSGLGHVARGVEGWAQDVAAALYAKGELVTLFKGAGEPQKPYEKVVRCLRREHPLALKFDSGLLQKLVWRFGIGTSYGTEQLTFALNLLRHLRAGSYDILHVQDPMVALYVQQAQKLKLVGTKVVLGHGTNEPGEFLRRIDFLQHLAPWHLEQLQSQGFWRPTWTAIPNFVDVKQFHPGRSDEVRAELGIPEDASVVLTVAAVKRGHKRVHHLIEEFASLRSRRPDLPLWLVVAGGRDAETEELVSWGKGLLSDRVRFLIGYPRVRMPELYRSANVFAFCSLREMMPMALVEATASGLPCIVHDHPIMRWICGPEACVIDMEERGGLARAIEVLTTDVRKCENLGSSAREWCVGHFSSECVVGQVLEYYHFAVASGREAGPRENAPGRAASDAASVA